MRSFVCVTIGMMALAGVASAQTPPSASDPDRGYVEAVAQAAFGNVTSQSYGAEGGVTIRPNLQLFVEVGRVSNVATSQISAAAQTIAGYLSQTQANVAYSVKEPAIFGVAGIRFTVPTGGAVGLRAGGAGVANVKQDVAFTIGGTDVTSNLTSRA